MAGWNWRSSIDLKCMREDFITASVDHGMVEIPLLRTGTFHGFVLSKPPMDSEQNHVMSVISRIQ